MNKITIYSNATCPYCKQVKEEFTKNNIEFESKLTNEWPNEWKDIIFLTNIPSVPTILYEEEYFVPGRDFRSSEHLVDVIKNHQKSSFTKDTIIVQQLKTLNYNIQVAFSRTNQLLTQIETKINTNEHKSTN